MQSIGVGGSGRRYNYKESHKREQQKIKKDQQRSQSQNLQQQTENEFDHNESFFKKLDRILQFQKQKSKKLNMLIYDEKNQTASEKFYNQKVVVHFYYEHKNEFRQYRHDTYEYYRLFWMESQGICTECQNLAIQLKNIQKKENEQHQLAQFREDQKIREEQQIRENQQI